MKKLIDDVLTRPAYALGLVTFLSVAALAAALTGQYLFGLHPCELCIYQRIPFAVVIFLGIAGLWASRMAGPKYGAFNLFLIGVSLFVNAAIAFYHVGVEQKWWASASCSVPDIAGMTPEELQARILSAPAVACDAIAFELAGISMAGLTSARGSK